MGTIVVTGSAGGIETRNRSGWSETGTASSVSTRGAEITADLATQDGRDAMVRDVDCACGGVLDGLVAGPA